MFWSPKGGMLHECLRSCNGEAMCEKVCYDQDKQAERDNRADY
jgi:hypothetical protein